MPNYRQISRKMAQKNEAFWLMVKHLYVNKNNPNQSSEETKGEESKHQEYSDFVNPERLENP